MILTTVIIPEGEGVVSGLASVSSSIFSGWSGAIVFICGVLLVIMIVNAILEMLGGDQHELGLDDIDWEEESHDF